MKHGSLFSGIGGFDLAAEWMGWENVFHCEINPFCQQVLKYYWPNAAGYTDITKTDFSIYRGRIDVLTGGFPCQPYSTAGKRLGKEDERHIWPEMLRAIREIQPAWIVGENVLGIVSWNGGLVFDEVQTDLEAEGYEVQPYVLPACAVNAPHRRDRVWFIAYAQGGYDKGNQREFPKKECRSERDDIPPLGKSGFGLYEKGNAANPSNFGLQLSGDTRKRRSGLADYHSRTDWQNFPTQSPVCNGDDGFPGMVDSDAIFRILGVEHPRQPAIGFGKWRNESIKAGGNAIVPQVAYQIFKAIQQYEHG